MNTCRTCVHWQNQVEYGSGSLDSDGGIKVGTCTSDNWLAGYHTDPTRMPSNGVLIENDEGWGMCCGPDFGCVHYEPKP